jgi:uncharacterized membrane protein YhdT
LIKNKSFERAEVQILTIDNNSWSYFARLLTEFQTNKSEFETNFNPSLIYFGTSTIFIVVIAFFMIKFIYIDSVIFFLHLHSIKSHYLNICGNILETFL